MPYSDCKPHAEQATKLLETGECDLPVDWQDLSLKVAQNPCFHKALQSFNEGNPKLLKMITEVAALHLCEAFTDGD